MRIKFWKIQGIRQTAPRAVAAVAAGVLLVAGLATAQQQPPDVQGLSPQQQLKRAEVMMTEMKEVLTLAFAELKAARESQDIQKLNQVNEALSAIKGLLRLSEQNFILLQEAVAKGDDRSAEHEFVKIAIAYQKVMEFAARIRSAGGPNTTGDVDGRPEIDVIVDSDIPTTDPTEDVSALDVLGIDASKPPAASPFL